MADGRADLQHKLRLARLKIEELEEDKFWLERQLGHQDRCMRQLQHDNDWLRSEFSQESQLLGVREREIFERGRAANRRIHELEGIVEDREAVIQRHVQDKETADRREHGLKAEVDKQKAVIQRHVQDKETAGRRKHQLKAEVENQKAVIQRHVQDKEAAVGRERELKAEVDKQKAVIQRYVKDKETADKRIQELEASRNNANPVPVPRDSPPATDNARPSKRRRQESPVADQQVSRVERERIDRPLAPKDSKREVPGLSLDLVQDENITERVVEKLTSVMEKPNSKKNMELFLEHAGLGRYYCIHEVISKGKSVSKPLTPSQPCRGCGSNIRVRTVRESGRIKLQVGHFTMEV